MRRIAVLPGSFDPITLGHIDVIRRATTLVDELHVVVARNPEKNVLLTEQQRVELIERSLADAGVAGSRIVVKASSSGLLVDYCRTVGATLLVKGIRSQTDIAYEAPMVVVNRDLAGVETVFLLADPAHALVSSSLVRQVTALGGDISPYVPAAVAVHLANSGVK